MPDQQDKATEETREWLWAFLQQLRANDNTNRALLQIQMQILQQLKADAGQREILSAQLDGVAQRIDIVDHSLAALSAVLDGTEAPARTAYRSNPRGARFPSVGQTIGGVVGLGVDRFMRGAGGGRGLPR